MPSTGIANGAPADVVELPLGVVTFRSSSIEHGVCGVNGLPLTPKSVRCVGRFESLRALRHQHLCQYIHIERDKYERVIIVSENYSNSLATCSVSDEKEVVNLMAQCLLGLQYLHSQKIVYRCMQPSTILLDGQDQVKLAQYGLFYITGCNVDIDFLIGSPLYVAPEVYLRTKCSDSSIENYPLDTHDVDPLCDVWSFGISFLQFFLQKKFVLSQLQRRDVIYLYLRIMRQRGNLLSVLETEFNLKLDVSEGIIDLLRSCLHGVPSSRPSVRELLRHPIFATVTTDDTYVYSDKNITQDLFDLKARFKRLVDTTCPTGRLDKTPPELNVSSTLNLLLRHRSLPELFHWWSLAGGDLHATLRDVGVYEHTPALLRLPCMIAADGFAYTPGAGLQGGDSALSNTIRLPGAKLQQRVERLNPQTFFPTLVGPEGEAYGKMGSQFGNGDDGMSQQPKLIKENDVQYQIERVILLDRLLRGFPHLVRNLRREAFTDIPPFLRSKIWAALLNVSSNIQERYAAIQASESCDADQQIMLDIPRCHQYDELLASGSGQAKLKRVIKCFLLSHKEKTYWQGLDSVAAPFVRLNFDNEALAFGCYEAFFNKYLYAFCNADSDAEMYKYNAVFRQLLCYHSPVLGNFLSDHHESVLQQFSVKNFLTMFSHVLPINLIFHLWDSIIAGDMTFPLFIGVAFLSQMEADQGISERPDEEVWAIITDAPEMDVERCLQTAKTLFCATPASACQNRAPLGSSSKRQLQAPGVNSRALAQLQAFSVDRNASDGTVASPNADNSVFAAAYPKKIPLSYEELLASRLPIISGEDVIKMLQLRKSRDGSQCVFIDIRAKKEFKRGCLPDSVNLPFTNAFNSAGALSEPQTEADLKGKFHHLVKVVVSGAEHSIAVEFANKLLRLKVDRICILQGGLSVLKPFNLLVLPTEPK